MLLTPTANEAKRVGDWYGSASNEYGFPMNGQESGYERLTEGYNDDADAAARGITVGVPRA